jgi:MraZ protein
MAMVAYNHAAVGRSVRQWVKVGWVALLRGEYEHQVDDKGRVTLPAKFRTDLAEGTVITRGFEPCLLVYTRQKWEVIEGNFRQAPVSNRAARDVRRYLRATESQLDRQGRIFIPLSLRQVVGIEKDVVICGASDYIEIWDRATWQAYQRDELAPEKIGPTAEALGIF